MMTSATIRLFSSGIAGILLLAACLHAETARPATTRVAAQAGGPRIAMLWSPASLPGKRPRKPAGDTQSALANWARHSILVVGADDLDLAWTSNRWPDLSESFEPQSIIAARRKLDRLHQLNLRAVVLVELYFFEAEDKAYPPVSPWWQRDEKQKRERFWPGCWNMDLSNAEYIRHIAARIKAVCDAINPDPAHPAAGIFLDNLRFEPAARAGWLSLLEQVRRDCGEVPILVNAGWDSAPLEWIAPQINGIMYEDAMVHVCDGKRKGDPVKDEAEFFGRVAASDRLVRQPSISINERFGKRTDVQRMMSAWIRTLVYTDVAYLYADSTQEHRHDWWPQWDAPLGAASDPPTAPTPGELARRRFAGGLVLWLPADAPAARTVELEAEMIPLGQSSPTRRVTLTPGTGTIVLRSE